jgi:hypothetical protein
VSESLFEEGKATCPSVAKSPKDLPPRWHGWYEQEAIARMSPLVPYAETSKYAFELTLREWRKDIARKRKKREAKDAARGVGGLFGTKEKQ